MSHRTKLWVAVTLLLMISSIFTACTTVLTPPGDTSPPNQKTLQPSFSFPSAPTTLCREATQLRLRPIMENDTPLDIAINWELSSLKEAAPLANGTWIPGQSDIFVAFPNGQTLSSGDYQFTLYADGQIAGKHTFTILDEQAQLKETTLYLTPSGPSATYLRDETRVFYIHYTYQAACPGAPLWVTITREEEPYCSKHIALTEEHGNGVIACYRENGELWEKGDYTATLTLMTSEPVTLPITIGSKFEAAKCEPLFAASAISPEGAPNKIEDRFEWYTQGIYVGTKCDRLATNTPWEIQWYRNGERTRTYESTWQGKTEGIIWDSLIGTETESFLTSGTYSVTLTLNTNTTLTTTFQVIPYISEGP